MKAILILMFSFAVCSLANAADVNMSIAQGVASATGKSVRDVDFRELPSSSRLPGRYTVLVTVAGEGQLECKVKINASGYPFHTICTGGRKGKYVAY